MRRQAPPRACADRWGGGRCLVFVCKDMLGWGGGGKVMKRSLGQSQD